MFLEAMAGLGCCYVLYNRVNADSIQAKKERQKIKEKWRILMDSIGTQAENKIKQEYQILDIFNKHYGVDMIVSIPFGREYNDILTLLPKIQATYKADVMANPSEDKNTAYIRLHFVNKEISVIDNLKFKWFKTFINLNGCRNNVGETLTVGSTEEIKSPNGEIVGYKVKSHIPIGVQYDNIKKSYDAIVRTLGKCFMDFNHKTMELEVSIIHSALDNTTKFYPIKVKPWELYIGMAHDWKPIILDYSVSANVLDGGVQGTGKTTALIAAFINLCTQCEAPFELMVAMMGEKNDLRIFKNVKQCKYYATTEKEVLSLLNYLKKEMDRRNKLFADREEFVFNIFKYNTLVDEKDRLPIIHFLSDEIADFMDNEKINPLLWDVIRKSRSAGIFFSVATQRGTKENLSSEFKGQLKNTLCFYQPNISSALTIVSGEDMAKKVLSLEKNREFICSYQDGVRTGKTLFIDENMMEKLLKNVIEKNHKHLQLDVNGNILTEKPQETAENGEKTDKNDEKSIKIGENPTENGQNDNKKPRFEQLRDKRKES